MRKHRLEQESYKAAGSKLGEEKFRSFSYACAYIFITFQGAEFKPWHRYTYAGEFMTEWFHTSHYQQKKNHPIFLQKTG